MRLHMQLASPALTPPRGLNSLLYTAKTCLNPLKSLLNPLRTCLIPRKSPLKTLKTCLGQAARNWLFALLQAISGSSKVC